MHIEIIGNRAAAEEILALTESWDNSVENCNAGELTRAYVDQAEIFDIGSQFTGREKYREFWQSCFAYFGSSPKVSRRRLKIYASGELAFIHCYSKICGSNMPKPEEQPWCRTTVCLRKVGAEWSVVHEHISMPIDFEKGAPAPIFGEP
jgi:ketosteroid isomerase-like protein